MTNCHCRIKSNVLFGTQCQSIAHLYKIVQEAHADALRQLVQEQARRSAAEQAAERLEHEKWVAAVASRALHWTQLP